MASGEARKKILAPLLPPEAELMEADERRLWESKAEAEKIEGSVFRNLMCEGEDFSQVSFSGVRLENCRFWNCRFEGAEFVNTLFQSCDVTGCDMSKCYMDRVAFVSCKGVGAKFTDSIIKNLSIENSNFNFSNFDMSRFENVRIEKTKLDSGNMAGCQCKNMFWKEVNLINTSFFKTSLRGMDFSDSQITGLVLSDDHSELRGVTVDLFQAAELAKRLGVIIKDI